MEQDVIKLIKACKALIWRCVFCESESKRIRYGKELAAFMDSARDSFLKEKPIIDDMIEKLATAGETIADQNDWINYLYLAAKENKQELISDALLVKNSIEWYKKKKGLEK